MYIILKQKSPADGRAFGTLSDPTQYLYVFITANIGDELPVDEYSIAPGSICIDISSSTKYFWYEREWVAWEDSSSSSSSEQSNDDSNGGK